MESKKPSEISGLIPINKTGGITSTDVSRLIKKKFGKIKLGHVGTLDPDAEGVLPVLVGGATKLQDYLLAMPKAYWFEFKFGLATDTLDSSGRPILELPWQHVSESALRTTVSQFIGPITQIPPIFSAVKYQGRELYKYAQAGITAKDVPLESLSRSVEIKDLQIESVNLPFVRMSVECSKGTYVRTLAADIAEALGTVAHVTKLIRTKSAGFSLPNCITIEQIASPELNLSDITIPFDSLAIGLPLWRLDDMVLLKRLVDGQIQVVEPRLLSMPTFDQSAQLLLRSFDDRSVGILDAKKLSDGRVELHLKRGFLCHQA